MNVREIVEKHLRENGYDGLVMSDLECGCSLDDLEPCGEISAECEAACRVKCDASCTHEGHDEPDTWHFQQTKPGASEGESKTTDLNPCDSCGTNTYPHCLPTCNEHL